MIFLYSAARLPSLAKTPYRVTTPDKSTEEQSGSDNFRGKTTYDSGLTVATLHWKKKNYG